MRSSTPGFMRAHQNAHALHMLRHWCRRAGVRWGQGIGAGGGGMLPETQNIPMGHGPKKRLGQALQTLAEAIVSGGQAEDLYITQNFPRVLYRMSAESVWRRKGRKTAFRNRSSLQRRARDLRPDGRPFRWAKRVLADRSGWDGSTAAFKPAICKLRRKESMAQFEKELHDADFYTVLSLLEKEILASGASVELVGTARYDLGDTQVAVRVYDRYFMRNASRASLTLTLVGHGGTVQVSAIGAGGGTGAFTHFDWGTGDAFVQLVKKILSKGPFEGM